MLKRHELSRVRLPPLPLGNDLVVENLEHRRRKYEMVFVNGRCMARDSSKGGTGYWDEFRKLAESGRRYNLTIKGKSENDKILQGSSSKKLLPPEFSIEKRFRKRLMNRSLLPAIGMTGQITRRWSKNGQWV